MLMMTQINTFLSMKFYFRWHVLLLSDANCTQKLQELSEICISFTFYSFRVVDVFIQSNLQMKNCT